MQRTLRLSNVATRVKKKKMFSFGISLKEATTARQAAHDTDCRLFDSAPIWRPCSLTDPPPCLPTRISAQSHHHTSRPHRERPMLVHIMQRGRRRTGLTRRQQRPSVVVVHGAAAGSDRSAVGCRRVGCATCLPKEKGR